MRLRSGVAAVPVFGEAEALSVCVLVARSPEGGVSARVLRSTLDAAVYAGCVVDGAGEVREWVEVWVQTPPGEAAAAQWDINNALLDERWRRAGEAVRGTAGGRVLGGPWETAHPGPLVIDGESGRAVVLGAGEASGAWALCTDEGVLAGAGLPSYAGTRSRYLWRPSAGASGPFVCVDGGGGEGWRSAAGSLLGALALNPHCGLMRVVRAAPVGFETYVDWLTNGQFHRAPAERTEAFGGELEREDPVELSLAHGACLCSVGGSAGLAAEVLYLKLRAIVSVLERVRSATARLDAPLLCLGPESLGVEVPHPSVGLPYAWGAGVVLDCVSEARELGSVEAGAPRRFTSVGGGRTSVYRPGGDAGPVTRSMMVRVRRVVEIESGRVAVEGTVTPRETVRAGGSTLVTIPLSVGGARVEVHTFLMQSEALSAGEFGFTSLPLRVEGEELAELRRLEGVEIGDAAVVLSPSVSSPADLHAVGVLALRVLVASTGESLGTAVVRAMSLAREIPASGGDGPSLAARVEAMAEQDPRWAEVLGPSRLLAASHGGAAVEGIPSRLWWGVIGAVCRLFPGAGVESYCADFGVGAGRGLASIYDAPIRDLGALAVQARSLVVVERRTCEEVGAVLDRHLALALGAG